MLFEMKFEAYNSVKAEGQMFVYDLSKLQSLVGGQTTQEQEAANYQLTVAGVNVSTSHTKATPDNFEICPVSVHFRNIMISS